MTATYRTLIIGGIAGLATSAAWRPDLAIVALTAIALGAFIRSEKWKAEYLDELGEWAGADE
jgi:hypothetical protein